MTQTRYVLSIDGGGVNGVYSAKVLQQLQQDTNVKWDLVIGSSIGSLLAGLVATNPQRDPMEAFTLANMRNILRKSPASLHKPKYRRGPKTEVLRDIFGKAPLKDAVIPSIVTAYNFTDSHPSLFRSWEGHHRNLSWAQAVDASSAAPTFFYPVMIRRKWYIDGGVAVNNPSLVGAVEARRLYPNSKIKVFSIGASRTHPKTTNPSWGPLPWLTHGLISVLTGAPNQVNWDMTKELIGEKNIYRLENRGKHHKLDDGRAKTYDKLVQLAREDYKTHKRRLRRFLTVP